MNYRPLGKTGLNISEISLGTVSLGVDYGIKAPDGFGQPDEAKALRLLQRAANAGINLFDTAPAYGESERLLGLALGSFKDVFIATKVSVPRDTGGRPLSGVALRQAVESSLQNSLRALQRDVLDIVQIHNATIELVESGEVTEILLNARRQGKVRFLGASVYTEAEALAIIKDGRFDLLQVAYNILDQRMAKNVSTAARHAGIGIIGRSAYLKGALTHKARWLPPDLIELKMSVERVLSELSCTWQSLSDTAVRFCLSNLAIATVLLGVRTEEELVMGLKAAEAGPLPEEILSKASSLSLSDEHLINPSYWPVA